MKIGCAGFCEGRKRYFNEFNVVEVQHTFYNPVPLSVLKKWREEAVDGDWVEVDTSFQFKPVATSCGYLLIDIT